MYILCVYAIMAPAHESETIVFNFRKLLSTLPNYAELEQILLFSVNWGKQVWYRCIDICVLGVLIYRHLCVRSIALSTFVC